MAFEGKANIPPLFQHRVVAKVSLRIEIAIEIEVHKLRELWALRRSEFWVAMVCLVAVLAFGPMQAVVVAFLMATIDLLRRASRPGTSVL